MFMRWSVIIVGLLLTAFGCAIAFAEGGIPSAPPSFAPQAQTQARGAPSPVQQESTDPPNPAVNLDYPLIVGTDTVLCPPQPQQQRIPLQVSWDNGLVFESDAKQFSLHIGGIGQIDTVFLIGPQSVFAAPGGASNGVG